MIPITYIRSSLFNQIKFCEHQYFLNYVLGLNEITNHRAEIGTCTHKILEILARLRLKLQTEEIVDYKDNEFNIELYGITKEDLNKPYYLSDLEVDKINSTRIAKDRYKWDTFIKSGHVRYGVSLVETLIKKVFDQCNDKSQHDWKKAHFNDVSNYVWIALDYKNGIFDPRKRKIVAPETFFDIEVKESWGKCIYPTYNINETLHLRGTIDLVTEIDENTYEIIDWKTGQRLDWATGEVKTYDKLQTDIQLLFYYYAAKKLWPTKNILVSIFFIRDGGPYTLPFEDDTLDTTESKIQELLETIQKIEVPKLLDPAHKDFRCNKICEYYKRDVANNKNMCTHIHEEIKKKGIDKVIELYTNTKHNPHEYNAPGDI